MLINSSFYFESKGRNGLVFLDDRWFTRFGQIRKNVSVTVEVPALFYSNNSAGGEISANYIGAFTYFNYNPDFRNVKEIGRFCSVGQNVIAGVEGHSLSAVTHHQIFERAQSWAAPFWEFDKKWIIENKRDNFKNENNRATPCYIGNDVWIGAGVIIKNGIQIGNGSVIAAGAVVTKDVNAYEVVGGCPAKCIRKRFSEDIVERLEKVSWWNYGPNILKGLDISNPYKCIDEIEDRVGYFPIYNPDKFEFDCKNNVIYKIYAEDGRKELIYKL